MAATAGTDRGGQRGSQSVRMTEPTPSARDTRILADPQARPIRRTSRPED
jgi:hypothetical protein